MYDFTGNIHLHGQEGADTAAQTAPFVEGYEGTGLVLQVFGQVLWRRHEAVMLQVVSNAFSGQADADIGDSRLFSSFFLAFRQIQGDAVADAERAFVRINRHDRAEMAQGAEEKIYRRQAAHAGFVDEAAAQAL